MSAVLSASAPVSSSAAIASVATGAVSSLSRLSRLSSPARKSGLAISTNSSTPPVLHRTAQPISHSEFVDALRAAAPPRFPHARSIYGRRVGLAISGGVDSMALAYLCSTLRPQHHGICIADAPIHGFNAVIIDHGLRDGSAAEAAAVAKETRRMGHRQQVIKMRWPAAEAAAMQTTALETNARRLRYRCLASHLAQLRIVSLLLAHHEDDQYETILMRLLSGYGLHGGIRGLRGMRAANDLPECYGIYGAHRSGFWDDQTQSYPYVQLGPSRRERRQMKADLRSEIDYAVLADELRAGGGGEWDRLDRLPTARLWDPSSEGPAPLSPVHTEDLGIVAYRPLLPFAKERLVATCMANGVRWFEDHTNADPTLTMRNALRHMVRRHQLPRALQKPAILQLAARSDATARQHEAQARRLIVKHGILRAFSPNIGTLVARLPPLRAHARTRPWQTRATSSYDAQATGKRRVHLRTVAALAIRTLLSYVAPEDTVTAVSQLQTVVDTLFPELASPGDAAVHGHAKAFSVCGVHWTPLLTTPRAWYLSRAPHATSTLHAVHAASAGIPSRTGSLLSMPQHPKSLPFATFPAIPLALRWNKDATAWPWSSWGRWVLYDGRFWIRLRTRLPVVISLQPFGVEYSKPFRDALAREHPSDTSDATGSQLTRFQTVLKAHAPGKVRYTLPGIYVAADVGWALRGEPYWPRALLATNHVVPREDESMRRHRLAVWEREQRDAEREQWPAPDRPAQHLLALPTIDVHVPGLRKWVQWEVRYKKVDTGLLDASLRQS